jgi:hypothetical protein
VGGGAKGSQRSGGQPELAAELDGGRQSSNPGEQDSLGTILRGTPSGERKFRGGGRPKIASRSQSNLMAT